MRRIKRHANGSSKDRWTTVVVGLGSPYGDDQAGWRLAEVLARSAELPARVIAVREATQLLNALRHCERLIAVDACRSGMPAGTVTHLYWPDPRIAVRHHRSTHGVGLFDVLKLAERLGDLPPSVEIFGIDVADCLPGHEIGGKVLRAVAHLAAQLRDEIWQAAAPAVSASSANPA